MEGSNVVHNIHGMFDCIGGHGHKRRTLSYAKKPNTRVYNQLYTNTSVYIAVISCLLPQDIQRTDNSS